MCGWGAHNSGMGVRKGALNSSQAAMAAAQTGQKVSPALKPHSPPSSQLHPSKHPNAVPPRRRRTAGDVLRNFGGVGASGMRLHAERVLKYGFGLSLLGTIPLTLFPLHDTFAPWLTLCSPTYSAAAKQAELAGLSLADGVPLSQLQDSLLTTGILGALCAGLWCAGGGQRCRCRPCCCCSCWLRCRAQSPAACLSTHSPPSHCSTLLCCLCVCPPLQAPPMHWQCCYPTWSLCLGWRGPPPPH